MSLPNRIRTSVRRQAEQVLETGRRYVRFDQVRQRHFWSTQLFTPGATGYIASGKYDIFTTPPGQVGQGYGVALSELETNWRSANRVPDNQNFEITEVGVTVTPIQQTLGEDDPFTDLTVLGERAVCFAQSTLVAITYLTNTVELGYVQDFAQASGPTCGTYVPFGPQGANTRVTSRYTTNGFSGPGLRRRFKIPILLQHGETFTFSFLIPRDFFSEAAAIQARLDFWATESFVEKS